jgi:hypothetical protein
VARPLANPDGSLTCLLTFQDNAGEWDVMALKVDAGAQKHGRRMLLSLPPSTRGLTGVAKEDGGFEVLWFDAQTSELQAQALDLDTLSTSGDARALGRRRSSPLAIAVPPVVGRDGYVSTVSVERDAVLFDWWTTRGPEGVVKSTRVALSEAEHAHSATLNMTTTQPAALLSILDRKHYVNAALGQTLAVDLGASDPTVPEQLLINARKDVFVSWAAAGVGIADRRLHLGSDYDLSDI